MTRSRSQTRTRARQCAVQGLYQWQVTGQDAGEIDEQFLAEQDMAEVELEYFRELLHQVPRHPDELDGHLRGLLDRALERVDPVERAILRLGTYELRYRPDVPVRVVINEAVNLAKRFGAVHGHKYVNSVLDKVAKELRKVELARAR